MNKRERRLLIIWNWYRDKHDKKRWKIFFRAVEELKSLKANNGKNNYNGKFSKQAQHLDITNGRREKNGRGPRFLSWWQRQLRQMKEKNRSFARKLKPYNTSRIKSRNFLTNIWHAGVKEEDLCDRKFVFDTHVLVTKKSSLVRPHVAEIVWKNI